MSWNFEVPTECELFQVVISKASAGSTMPNEVKGDPIGDTGLVRVKTASATLEGELRIDYGNDLTVYQKGFQAGVKEYPVQALPPGHTINTALTDIVGFCATPKDGKRLRRRWVRIPAGKTRQHKRAGYAVVVKGEVLVNAHTLTPYTIGKGEQFDMTAVEDSIVCIIWER